ncbi:MAG TPA: TetR/AcrR family transcriptional regulator [Xanthobacteraceae bacterium]|nr:TetR/AcrR family transcriptional regulator [Xanthobacteraceae bacterium]
MAKRKSKTAKHEPSSATRQRRRAEIIDAAAHIFARRGFHGASTQDIADVLGVRQASLYYYFPSKEVALEMVCARGVEGFVEAAISVTETPGTAAQKLAGLIQSHLNPLRDRRDYVNVFLNERRHLPTESRRRIGRHSRAVEKIFQDVLRAGVEDGEFRADLDTRLAALAILGMVNAVAAWYDKERGAPVERIAQEFAALVLDGIRKKSSRR